MKKEQAGKGSFFFNNRNLFIKDSKGKIVYYPWGIWGRGYYVEAGQEKQVGISIAFLSFMIFVSIFLAFLIVDFFKTSFAVALIIALILAQGINYFRIKKVTMGLKKCDAGLTMHQRIKASVYRYKLWQLIVGGGIFLYFLILTFFRPFFLGSAFPTNDVDPIFWPILFGICVIYYAYLLFVKVTSKNK